MITKSKITITINKIFDEYMENNYINKSKLINELLKKHIEEIKKLSEK